MKFLNNIFSSVDKLSANAATVIAIGCEVSLILSIAAIMMVDSNFFAALETAATGIKLLSIAVTVSLIWDLSVNRTSDQNDAT